MTKPRSSIVNLDVTQYYHCTVRCVRRSFLCGKDKYSGENYDHRREWILDRIQQLTSIFCIDVCAYAIMSNHYHIVLHIDKDGPLELTDNQVMEHWCSLFKGPLIIQRLRSGEPLSQAERETASSIISVWRKRLNDLGWFMKCLNEFISRLANKEDNCKGHFWESRYKSQALVDEIALLSCMCYVDLNPIRAGIADSLENSEFTSIKERLIRYREDQTDTSFDPSRDKFCNQSHSIDLVPMKPSKLMEDSSPQQSIPFKLLDYIQLVEWTGRIQRPDKRGAIPIQTPPILLTLGANIDEWQCHINQFGSRYFHVVGSEAELRCLAEEQGYEWLKGLQASSRVYS